MRYAIALSAVVASALAQPQHGHLHQKLHQKRDIVLETEVQVVYKTVVVTDIVDGPSPTAITTEVVESSTVAATPTSVQLLGQQFGGSNSDSSSTVSVQPSTGSSDSISVGASIPVPSADATGFEAIALLHHNVHRANHSVPALTWSDQLASWAQQIASSCDYNHSDVPGAPHFGQNIAAGIPANNISMVVTDMFYNGEINSYGNQYGSSNPGGFESWGHFSQVVWATTTEVGCAVADCSSTGLANAPGADPYFTVCNYMPAGNVDGGYASGVKAPLGQQTVNWNYGL